MKRSAGLTTIGVFMMLFGGCHSLGNGTLLIAPFALDVFVDSMKDVEGNFEGTLAQSKPQRETRFSPQEVAEGKEAFRELRQAFERLQLVLRTPEAKIILALQVVVGMLVVAAGLGSLQLATWARSFAIGQAWLALVIVVVGEFLTTSGGPALSQEPHPGRQDVVASLAQVGWALVWNGVIIWFFNRRSTKAQFRREE